MIRQFFNGICMALEDSVPGVSGGTIAFILGFYDKFIGSINDIIYELSVFPALCIFGFGVIAGALSVVKEIKVCLDKHRSKTMYTIIGLMVGSLYAIAMGPTTLKTPQAALSINNFNIIAFVIGIAIVAILQFVGNKKEAKAIQ